MEPVSNVGRFTRILLIIIGIVLIVTGAVLTTMQFTAIGEPQTTATITGFRTISEQNVPDKATVTIVSYSINGKKYDTDTARYLGCYENCDDSWNFKWFRESLYVKKTGEYFLYGEGGPLSVYAEFMDDRSSCSGNKIIPLSEMASFMFSYYNLSGVLLL